MDLRQLAAALRRRWKLVAGCVVLLAGTTFAVSQLQTPQYEATAKLLFRDPGFDQRIFGASVVTSGNDPDREAQTNVELVSLDVVAERTAQELSGSGLDSDSIEEKVAINAEGQSNVVAIKATDSDPDFAARLSNTMAEIYVDFRREADRAKVANALRLVEQELRNGDSGRDSSLLRDQISDLKTLEALQTGNAELVQPAAVPDSQASPKVARNTAIGLILGLMLGVGAGLMAERLDRRLRDPEDVEDLTGRPVLSTVPLSDELDEGHRRISDTSSIEYHAFSMLRTRLRYFNVDRNVRTVLVTSAVPGEGKTTVAINLAVAEAAAGAKVALVEADMRHSTFARTFGVPAAPGLSELLTQQAGASVEKLRRVAAVEANESRTLTVLPGGATPPNPVELTESERMAALLDDLAADHDLIVIDSPPVSVVPDAIPLVRRVDGVLAVARMGLTSRDALADLVAQLTDLGGDVLGVVVNALKHRHGLYGYAYGYGYGQANGRDPAASAEPETPAKAPNLT